ncbi:hypothetical protein [Mesorhizobium sp.]|uniref:hypothetical protein n=1 Tax=Mesorhizobium sp. TaxID=1871066 RepID=UPI001209E80D|nr:hypothetical protein [Mesorhizobium sp.]TIL38569.1 MAG: hypothetical protein E5Y82_13825 [Mesorhizobium sp.]
MSTEATPLPEPVGLDEKALDAAIATTPFGGAARTAMGNAIRAYLAALGTQPVPVAVKGLEWLSDKQPFFAYTPFCYYRIEPVHDDTGRYWATDVRYQGASFHRSETEDEAKAFAQADYEARIRSALAPPTQAVPGDVVDIGRASESIAEMVADWYGNAPLPNARITADIIARRLSRFSLPASEAVAGAVKIPNLNIKISDDTQRQLDDIDAALMRGAMLAKGVAPPKPQTEGVVEALREALKEAMDRHSAFRQLLVETIDSSPPAEGAAEFIGRLSEAMEASADEFDAPRSLASRRTE